MDDDRTFPPTRGKRVSTTKSGDLRDVTGDKQSDTAQESNPTQAQGGTSSSAAASGEKPTPNSTKRVRHESEDEQAQPPIGTEPDTNEQEQPPIGTEPDTNEQEQPPIGTEPNTTGQAPSTNGHLPSTNGQAPSTNGQLPSTNGQAPSTNGQLPATSGQASPSAEEGHPPPTRETINGSSSTNGTPLALAMSSGTLMLCVLFSL